MEFTKLESAIEAILFAMGDSVELEKIAAAIEQDTVTTRKMIRQMMERYESEKRGIQIIELENSFSDVYKDRFVRISDEDCKAAEEICADRYTAGNTGDCRI